MSSSRGPALFSVPGRDEFAPARQSCADVLNTLLAFRTDFRQAPVSIITQSLNLLTMAPCHALSVTLPAGSLGIHARVGSLQVIA